MAANLPRHSSAIAGSFSHGSLLGSNVFMAESAGQGRHASPLAGAAPPGASAAAAKEATPEEQSQWLSEILTQNPQFLAMRERSLPLTGGYSFANITHTQKVSALSCVNRHTILALIVQHLQAIGMHRTAETLIRECGHSFQKSSQSWERTDLHLLASIAVSHHEDMWNLPPDFDHKYIPEELEEDFFASPYREDPSKISDELANPDLNVVYDDSGQKSLINIKQCSLRRFAVHFATQTWGAQEPRPFWLSLYSITSASHFLEHLVTLYDLEVNPQWPKLRLNIVNFIKKWTEYHIGNRTRVLRTLFLKRVQPVAASDPATSRAISTALNSIAAPRAANVISPVDPDIPDPMKMFSPLLGLLDPPPVIVAQQITLIYHAMFAAIHSAEFMTAISTRKTSIRTPTIAEFFAFGDALTNLIAETFVKQGGKREAFIGIFKILEALASGDISNLDAVSSIIRFLRRDDILRLAGADAADREKLKSHSLMCGEPWRTAQASSEVKKPTPAEKAADREQYDKLIEQRATSWQPTIPNMRIELKSGDRVALTQQEDFINGLINWDKLKDLANKCAQLDTFQRKGYAFVEIPQIQRVILEGTEWSAAQIEEKLDELSAAKA
jgi:hypothetical protein